MSRSYLQVWQCRCSGQVVPRVEFDESLSVCFNKPIHPSSRLTRDPTPLIKFNATKAVEFMQDIIYRFGMPNRIITDLGSPFISIEFRSQAQDYDISIDYASLAHPQANSQVEWANGLLLAGLKPRLFDKLKDYGGKWIYELPKVV